MIRRTEVLPLMGACTKFPSWSTWLMSKVRTKTTSPVLSPTFSLHPRKTLTTTASFSLPNCQTKNKVIVVSGPTGTGKTRLALELAKRLDGEIISADSVQVYQGLDIGSAKPSLSDRAQVAHHLIDILHPTEEYSAGQFYRDARTATQQVLEKGKVPVVTGGTGLYLRWYIYGKPEVPIATREVASTVWSEMERFQMEGKWEAAVELVVQSGDSDAYHVEANNWYRLRRKLEIIKSSGAPPSAFTIPYNEFREDDTGISLDEKELDYDFLCIFLTGPRVDLYRSIDLRCEEMLMDTSGLLSEASWLIDIGLKPDMNSATRAIGYRQAMEYLLHCRENNGNSSPREFYDFLSGFQKVSRNFAKRQMTWFRNERIYRWVDSSKPFEEIADYVCDTYYKGRKDWAVPKRLEIKREGGGRRESYELKSYRMENKMFRRVEDFDGVLDWIHRTQRGNQVEFGI